MARTSIRKKLTIKRFRYGTGSYVNGRFQKGEPETKCIKVSVQNHEVEGAESVQVESIGDWNRDWKQVFCDLYDLRPSDDKLNLQADQFEFDNKTYEVKRANDWEVGNTKMNHTEAFAVRIK